MTASDTPLAQRAGERKALKRMPKKAPKRYNPFKE